MRRHILLGFQFGRQFRHRDVRPSLDPLEQSRQMRSQFTATRRTPLPCRLRRTRSRHPIGQLHRKARADIVTSSCCTPRLPALNFRLNTLPKVNRIRLSHPCWPPFPSQHLESEFRSLGIPFQFLFQARRSRTRGKRSAPTAEAAPPLPTRSGDAKNMPVARSIRCVDRNGADIPWPCRQARELDRHHRAPENNFGTGGFV